jgi:hypothetical protein
MAFWENAVETVTESGLGTGLLVAGGMMLAWPIIRPVLRETAKLAIKGGIVAYDYGSSLVAQAGEGLSDITAEARHEAGLGGEKSSASSGSRPRGSDRASPAAEGTPPSPSVSPG